MIVTPALITTLRQGRLAVIPTDTMYGLVGSALQPATVEKIYQLRRRETNKPLIVLLSELIDLKNFFGLAISPAQREKLLSWWPGAISVILSGLNDKFTYLHRGTGTVAYRQPANGWLKELLKGVGPLVAPSANLAGQAPAITSAAARAYFGSAVDYYHDAGELSSIPSTLVSLAPDGSYQLLRSGAGDSRL